MTSRDALFQAILAAPDDDAVRLVFADWLEEYGTAPEDAAQSELIRVQIAREAADPDGDDYWVLRARERNLLAGWRWEPGRDVRDLASRHRFRRGFVEWVEMNARSLAWRLHQLQRLEPIRRVALFGTGGPLTSAALAGIDGLDLRNAAELPTSLAETRALAAGLRLRSLDVCRRWWMLLVAALESGAPLEHLGFGTGEPGPQYVGSPEGAVAPSMIPLATRIPNPPAPRSLDVRGMYVAASAYERLLGGPLFRRAERAWIHRASADDGDPLALLVREPQCASLRWLSLTGERGGRVPAGAGLCRLRHLVLRRCAWLAHQGAETLRDLGLGALETLRVENAHDPRGLVGLLDDPGLWPRLRVLEIAHGTHHRDTLPRLVGTHAVSRLRRLELPTLPEGGPPRDRGPLPLAELTLTATDPPTPLGSVVRSSVLPNLTALEIAAVRVYDTADLDALLDRGRFPRLVRLHLGGVRLDADWQRRFAARFGDGAILSPEPVRAFPGDERILEEPP